MEDFMNFDIDWQRLSKEDTFSSTAKAKATLTKDQLILLFHRKDAEYGDEVSGSIILALHRNTQTIRGVFQVTQFGKTIETPYELTGSFVEDSWQEFKGNWEEGDEIYEFSALCADEIEEPTLSHKLKVVENETPTQEETIKAEKYIQDQLEGFSDSWSKIDTPLTFPESLKSFFDKWSKLPPKTLQTAQVEQSTKIDLEVLSHFLTTLLPPAMLALKKWHSLGSEINVWEVAGLKSDEVRNSRVLKWLLDWQGSHGQGDKILLKLLKSLKLPNFPSFESHVGHYTSRVESSPLGERENRVDIEIDGHDFLLFIEVKINASETNDQLDRYLISAKAKAGDNRPWCVLYLTQDGRDPRHIENPKAPRYEFSKHLIPLSWRDITKVLKEYAKEELPVNSYSHCAINSFISHIQKFKSKRGVRL